MKHLERLIKSGIFQVETKNDTENPIGVYGLTGTPDNKTLSKRKTISGVDIRRLVFLLERILSQHNSHPGDISGEILRDTLKDIENDLSEVLIKKYHFTKEEASKYVKEIFKKKTISKVVRKKLLNTGVFDAKKADKRYMDLIVCTYQAFCECLHTKRESNTDWYIAHFLVGCGIEKGTPKAVYNRIRTFRKRYEFKNPAFKPFRKNPEEVITIP